MIPVVIDPERIPLALVGRGDAAHRRLEGLLEGGAKTLSVYSDIPPPSLLSLAGSRLVRRLPEAEELAGFALVWIAGLPSEHALPLADALRALGVLVNVEDERVGCDFHNPAQLRRGDLLISVSTNARSPGLAARIKQDIERRFGPEWAARIRELDERRVRWRHRPRSVRELATLTEAMLDAKGWLERGRTSG